MFGRLSFLMVTMLVLLASFAGESLSSSGGPEEIDVVVETAISQGLIAGGIVLVGNASGVICQKSYGRIAALPDAPPVNEDTVFDVASLTKVLATTPAIMKLAEEGKVGLLDPVSKWFPEFADKEKQGLLVYHLLTHTSGLDDFSISAETSLQQVIDRAASQKAKGEFGSRFRYADINFILLGELVRRASGQRLDKYVQSVFFAPLGMQDSCFTPQGGIAARCAATLDAQGNPRFSQVQDYTARQLDGIAGHAGLFTTARDISRYCMMLLQNGVLQGRKVLEGRTVRQMAAPYFSRKGTVQRGLGWDISSPYSSPRGNFSEYSYGHTGYSGCSLWIDPEAGIYVIFLSSRIDYHNTRAFNQLRGDISSRAALLCSPITGTARIGTNHGQGLTR